MGCEVRRPSIFDHFILRSKFMLRIFFYCLHDLGFYDFLHIEGFD